MAGTWVREEDPDFATQRIFDGAARAFVDLGVSGAGMTEIATYVGCSRGTLYRYFKNRHELHLAFVNNRAVRLAAVTQDSGLRAPPAPECAALERGRRRPPRIAAAEGRPASGEWRKTMP